MVNSVLVINGPNLNLLGLREPQLYGATTLSQLESGLRERAATLGIKFDTFQSNCEGAIIDRIHQARGEFDVIVINAGGLTHTSVALRDAFSGVAIPFIELHVTNTHAREEFRHKSFLSEKAVAVIMGFGVHGYYYALDHAANNVNSKK
ncbi:dehydroquinase class II [Kockiozyma suomiensis]|uniref:dehydroquinase class II n=1 Tax=Kockiozyma suomiensis TaxID=1337062 RepID=UPI0033430B3A